jgi:excisionase family DNA binding protein
MLRVTALLMNKKQTAAALHISVRTVERLLARKKLPRLLIGGSVRIPIDAVMKITSPAQ